VCFDASVVVKWFLREELSDRALQQLYSVRSEGRLLIAPLVLHGEVASALYKMVSGSHITLAEARAAYTGYASLNTEYYGSPDVAQLAMELAASLGLKWVYEAFYLALGEIADCDVWTADRAFFRAAGTAYPRLKLLA
jgi:predicted nucleic acid-binding protein